MLIFFLLYSRWNNDSFSKKNNNGFEEKSVSSGKWANRASHRLRTCAVYSVEELSWISYEVHTKLIYLGFPMVWRKQENHINVCFYEKYVSTWKWYNYYWYTNEIHEEWLYIYKIWICPYSIVTIKNRVKVMSIYEDGIKNSKKQFAKIIDVKIKEGIFMWLIC